MKVETEMIAKSNKRFGNLRDWWARYAPFDTARLLQSQAIGTKKCLEALKASGRDIPQETIDVFAAQGEQFVREVTKLNPGKTFMESTICPTAYGIVISSVLVGLLKGKIWIVLIW